MWTRATSRPLNRREGVQPSSGGSPRVTSAAETEGSPNLRAAAARQLMPPPGAVSPKRKAAGSDVDRPRSAGSDASDGSVGSAGGNARRQRRQRGDGGIPLGTKGAGGGRKGGGRGGGRGGGSGRGR